ncbi:hypothetical protein Bbelb_055720 [Branchiostoma belcheri]|nr:hypothetical protein Bbelb_055720 [Branchiostoma belcheri]
MRGAPAHARDVGGTRAMCSSAKRAGLRAMARWLLVVLMSGMVVSNSLSAPDTFTPPPDSSFQPADVTDQSAEAHDAPSDTGPDDRKYADTQGDRPREYMYVNRRVAQGVTSKYAVCTPRLALQMPSVKSSLYTVEINCVSSALYVRSTWYSYGARVFCLFIEQVNREVRSKHVRNTQPTYAARTYYLRRTQKTFYMHLKFYGVSACSQIRRIPYGGGTHHAQMPYVCPHIGECAINPCQHGRCVLNKDGGYHCNCHNGWTGNNCQIDIDACAKNTCQYSLCDVGGKCTCKRWTGPNCQRDLFACSKIRPCEHGDCEDTYGGYKCTCFAGWTGENCQIAAAPPGSVPPWLNLPGVGEALQEDLLVPLPTPDDIDECATNPCQHGHCVDKDGEYTCICSPGWTGQNCDKRFNLCTIEPCHHGTCKRKDNGYSCTCSPGWTGLNCHRDIDECAKNPCPNGRCENKDGGYKCICHPGWSGKNCQQDINECTRNHIRARKPCEHGTCVNIEGGYKCVTCSPGWTGQNCQQLIDECATKPCEHGTCENKDGGYKCTCSAGWTGKNCQQESDVCVTTPCQNGTCVNQDGRHRCRSTPGPSGRNCQQAWQCQSGWSEYNNHCYKYVKSRVDWFTADARCKACGANLVSIHSREENEFVSRLIPNDPRRTHWHPFLRDRVARLSAAYIGLRKWKAGSWMWSDGSQVQGYTDWAGGPNDRARPTVATAAGTFHVVATGVPKDAWDCGREKMTVPVAFHVRVPRKLNIPPWILTSTPELHPVCAPSGSTDFCAPLCYSFVAFLHIGRLFHGFCAKSPSPRQTGPPRAHSSLAWHVPGNVLLLSPYPSLFYPPTPSFLPHFAFTPLPHVLTDVIPVCPVCSVNVVPPVDTLLIHGKFNPPVRVNSPVNVRFLRKSNMKFYRFPRVDEGAFPPVVAPKCGAQNEHDLSNTSNSVVTASRHRQESLPPEVVISQYRMCPD